MQAWLHTLDSLLAWCMPDESLLEDLFRVMGHQKALVCFNSLTGSEQQAGGGAQLWDMHALLKQGMESGEVAPLPWTVYARERCQDAFRFLASGAAPGSLVPSVLGQSRRRARPGQCARQQRCHGMWPVAGGAGSPFASRPAKPSQLLGTCGLGRWAGALGTRLGFGRGSARFANARNRCQDALPFLASGALPCSRVPSAWQVAY